MDPDTCLKEARKLASAIVDDDANTADARRLAELLLALDTWIENGGFLPKAWRS